MSAVIKHLERDRLAAVKERDKFRAEVKDLRARLKAARELHWAISLVEREAFDALLRATDLRVKRWKP